VKDVMIKMMIKVARETCSPVQDGVPFLFPRTSLTAR